MDRQKREPDVMEDKKLYIKNMVCDRCIMAVQNIMEQNALPYSAVTLGEVELIDSLPSGKMEVLKNKLQQLGFELIEDKTARLVSAIKTAVLDFVRSDSTKQRQLKFSAFISDKLSKDYNYLSHLFSEIEGTTIEQYVINQKIERVKELLVYDELSLSEIAHLLSYSSVQHLSNQFKKVTGLTPSHFKSIRESKRKPLDKV